MAPSDNTKVVLGFLAIAGIGVTLYLISRQLRKKKKGTSSSPEPEESHDDQSKKAPETLAGGGDGTTEQDTEEPTPAPSPDPTAASMSMSTWEEIQAPSDFSGYTEAAPVTESFVEVTSSVTEAQSSGSEGGQAVEEVASSALGQDDGGCLAKPSAESDLDLQEENQQHGSLEDIQGENNNQPGTDNLQLLNTSTGHSVEDSLPSFECVSNDDHTSDGTEISNALADVHIEPLAAEHLVGTKMSFEPLSQEEEPVSSVESNTESIQSFEQIGETVQSFEHISDPGNSQSLKPGEGSSEFIQPPTSDSVTTENGIDSKDVNKTVEREADVPENHDDIANSKDSVDSKSNGIGEKSTAGIRITQIDVQPGPLQNGSRDSVDGSEQKNENGLLKEMAKKALGGSREEFYSSESLQSLGTTASGGSQQQDFFTPISSPRETDTSEDNLSFCSFDDSEDNEELSDYGAPVEGAKTPQDRTPTNTPLPTEDGTADITSMDMSMSMITSSMIEATTPVATTPTAVNGSSHFLTLDKDRSIEAIYQAQSNPGQMEDEQLRMLVELLKQDDPQLLNTALHCITQTTAFTVNVNVLTFCDGAKELACLLEKFTSLLIDADKTVESQAQGDSTPNTEALFLSTARAVNNLAMDMKAQQHLESTIPVLTDLLMTEGISETVTLASLQPLTNMATNKAYHGHYTRLLQQLYSFLDTSQSSALRLQCLKLLVNLSLNADMVPHMLAAKAPSCLLDLLDINYDVDLLLRTVTFLANVMTIMQERNLSPSSLPPDEKAPSPETLYAALSALDRRDVLRNKVFRLTRHESQDVCYQASRLYSFVVAAK